MLVISQLRYRLRTDFEIGQVEVTSDFGKSSFTSVGDECLTGAMHQVWEQRKW